MYTPGHPVHVLHHSRDSTQAHAPVLVMDNVVALLMRVIGCPPWMEFWSVTIGLWQVTWLQSGASQPSGGHVSCCYRLHGMGMGASCGRLGSEGIGSAIVMVYCFRMGVTGMVFGGI